MKTKEEIFYDVIDICLAYEQGYGHGEQNSKLQNPYKENSPMFFAWNHGHTEGKISRYRRKPERQKMFEKRNPPEKFPCFFSIGDEQLCITSEEHYNYLNEAADKLYQLIYGYISQPEHDYFCSTHPQESNCFAVALSMDSWVGEHEFNN